MPYSGATAAATAAGDSTTAPKEHAWGTRCVKGRPCGLTQRLPGGITTRRTRFPWWTSKRNGSAPRFTAR
jgi:hypothetical protein